MIKSKKNLQGLLKIDGEYYALNVKKICDFISERSGKEVVENEILDTFDFSGESGEKSLAAKTVRELKSPGNGQENIIYDLIKIFIIQVIAYDGDGDVDLYDLPFGTKLAFNTLLMEEFLVKIDE